MATKGGRFLVKSFYDLGNGRRVRFWKDIRCEDIWCGDTRLSTSFPSLFTIVTSKGAWVCDVWEHTNFGGCWNPCFVKNFQDWELGCVEALLLCLHSKSMSREVDDKAVWMATKGGWFLVKSFYDGMVQRGSGRFRFFPYKDYLEFLGLNKSEFLCLRSNLEGDFNYGQLEEERLDFGEHLLSLQRRGGILGSHPSYCSKASLLWQLVFSLFGVVRVLHTLVQATLLSWHSRSVRKRKKKAWNVVTLCLFWIIWKERKRRAFHNVELSNKELKFSFVFNFLEWTKEDPGQESFSMIDFID